MMATAAAAAARGSTCLSQIASVFGVRKSFLQILIIFFFFYFSTAKATRISGDAHAQLSDSVPSRVIMETSSRPSTLVIYDYNVLVGPKRTQVTVAPPSRNANASLETDFGTVVVYATVLREDETRQSLEIGRIKGQGIFLNDRSVFLVYTAVITTARYSGTLGVQGHVDQSLNGELAITGGTGDFRWARGYVETFGISRDPECNIFRHTFHLKYD